MNPDAASRRWTVSFLLVVTLHVAAAWMLARAHLPVQAPADVPAILLELPPAPPPAAPPAVETPPAPVAPPPPVETQPPPPVPTPMEPPPPKVEAPVETLPVEPPPPPALPPRRVSARPVPKPTPVAPPQAAAPAPATETAAPRPAAPASVSNAIPSWEGQVLARLQAYQQYPMLARSRHWEGVVDLRLRVDRQGHVQDATVQKSSGYETLDNEALALVRRADPLPPPPAEMPGASVTLMAPIRFHLQ